jgi:hypothetical protein
MLRTTLALGDACDLEITFGVIPADRSVGCFRESYDWTLAAPDGTEIDLADAARMAGVSVAWLTLEIEDACRGHAADVASELSGFWDADDATFDDEASL